VGVESPREVTAEHAVEASLAFDELRLVGDSVLWIETRPRGGGARMLVQWCAALGSRDLTPPGFDVGSGIHAYGGGSYATVPGVVWCSGAKGGLHQVTASGTGQPIISAVADVDAMYGDVVEHGGELLSVRESAGSTGVGDALVAVPIGGNAGEARVLARSDGFFAAPQPTAGRLAWVGWDGDQMPWDGSRLWVADYRSGGPIGERVQVAGGRDESVLEPRWGPDGQLYFVSDRSGWWNLYRWDGSGTYPVAAVSAECAAAPWELGYSSYAFLDDGRIVIAVQDGPRHGLALIERDGALRRVDLPYTFFKPYLAARGQTVGMIGASPSVAPQVVRVNLAGPSPGVEVLARAEPVGLDGVAISEPEQWSVLTPGGRHLVALFYPPTGAHRGSAAPLIVRAHPGPTASSPLRLDWQVQFFTSRGFAVVDVDYSGSTGYGRAFRQSLYGRWGIDDVTDCRAVAEHALRTGRAVGGQVFIRGASAGGYTALQAICADGPFAAATAVSAIVDPDHWVHHAPRFQQAHAVHLRGGAGAVRAEAIRRPVLLIHGTGDPVAPVTKVAELADGLAARRIPHRLLILGEVGHLVAVSADAQSALQAELHLYRTVIDT
jgi:dipeptidyl aminopeptidase/acylaminoacyl peptidase